MTENNAAQPGLTDDQIEALAKKHIAPHADRLEAIMTNPVPYQQTEQFRRVKALIGDLLSKLRAEGVQAGDERAVRIPVPFSVDTTHKNQAFVTLGFYDEALRKEFVRAVCSGGFRVPTDAQASAPVADSTLPLEQALYELVNKIDSGLDTGDLVQDARRASTLLGAIMASAPVAGEACAWFTEDHLTDKSATTWDRTVAERWRAKGWPVRPLIYGDAAPQANKDGAQSPANRPESRASIDSKGGALDGGDCAKGASGLKRYVVLKALGSRYAYVNDTLEGRTVKRFDVIHGDGWEHASLLAARLNNAHFAALAAQPSGNSGELAAQEHPRTDGGGHGV